jgi:hypothetical protein
MARSQIPLLETLFDEVNRLAVAAGGEGGHTEALDRIRQVEEAVWLLLGAAEWGADAHPDFKENVARAKELLGIGGDAESGRGAGNEGSNEEIVIKAVRRQKDHQVLLREALMVLKEIRSLLRTSPYEEE